MRRFVAPPWRSLDPRFEVLVALVLCLLAGLADRALENGGAGDSALLVSAVPGQELRARALARDDLALLLRRMADGGDGPEAGGDQAEVARVAAGRLDTLMTRALWLTSRLRDSYDAEELRRLQDRYARATVTHAARAARPRVLLEQLEKVFGPGPSGGSEDGPPPGWSPAGAPDWLADEPVYVLGFVPEVLVLSVALEQQDHPVHGPAGAARRDLARSLLASGLEIEASLSLLWDAFPPGWVADLAAPRSEAEAEEGDEPSEPEEEHLSVTELQRCLRLLAEAAPERP